MLALKNHSKCIWNMIPKNNCMSKAVQLAEEFMPMQRQAPLSFGGSIASKTASSNKKGKSHAAQGMLPVTAYFK